MRGLVRFGHIGEFLEAGRRYNAAREAAELPAYRMLSHSGAGRVNEVFFLAEYDGEQEIEAADARVAADSGEIREALTQMYSHLLDGSVVETRLEEI